VDIQVQGPVGPAWTDFVGVLPLARADGVDVDAWLRRSPLSRDAHPDDVDTWLAAAMPAHSSTGSPPGAAGSEARSRASGKGQVGQRTVRGRSWKAA
jgi:hypothetical protein